MKNAHNRQVDTTLLEIEFAQFQCMIHRDYMAHCWRWSHVIKYLMMSDIRKDGIRILEIGCGKRFPLASELVTDVAKMKNLDHPVFRTLRAHKLITNTDWYVGVDVGKNELSDHLKSKASKGRILTVDETNFADFTVEDLQNLLLGTETIDDDVAMKLPNVIVCHEVAEHMPYENWVAIMSNMGEFFADSDPETMAFVSTPNFSGQAAKNHVNEYKYEAFGAIIEDHGFGFPLRLKTIPEKRALYPEQRATIWGTFGQQRKIYPIAEEYYSQYHPDVWEESLLQTEQYFDPNVQSTIWASLFPREASNAMWQFSLAPKKYKRYFPNLNEVEEPWGSGWVDDAFSKRGRKTEPDKVKPANAEPLSIAEVTTFTTVGELVNEVVARGLGTEQAWFPEGDTPIDFPATTIMEILQDEELHELHPAMLPIRFSPKPHGMTPGVPPMIANFQTWCMDLMTHMANAPDEVEEAPKPKAKSKKKKNTDLTVADLIEAAADNAAMIFVQVVNTENEDEVETWTGMLNQTPFTDSKLHNCTGSYVPPGAPLVQESNLLELYKLLTK